MNRSTSLCIAAIAATLIAGPAMADTFAKTRDQVNAELAEAIRTGDIIAIGSEGNLTLKQQFPGLYPQQAVAEGKTRNQVRIELAEAIRTGDIVAAGSEDSLKLNEQRSDLYPQTAAAGKSRAEVRAELAQAISTGDIVMGSEGNVPLNQQYPGFYMHKAERINTASGDSSLVSAN